MFLRAFIVACVGTLALTASASAEEETIGLRADAKATEGVIASSSANHTWLKKELKAEEFQRDAAKAARRLGDPKLDSDELSKIGEAIRLDTERAGAAFANCLNAKNCPDAQVRLGAVRGIKLAKPRNPNVSKALAACVIVETNADVRTAAAALIRDQKDPIASKALVDYYVDAFDTDGVLIKADHERAAIDALKAVGGHGIYEQLLMYATLEVRAGMATEIGPPQTVYITNGGSINSPSGTINLPIELPNLELRAVNTTIVVPALGALRQVSGQNFGRNIGKWQDWIGKQN